MSLGAYGAYGAFGAFFSPFSISMDLKIPPFFKSNSTLSAAWRVKFWREQAWKADF